MERQPQGTMSNLPSSAMFIHYAPPTNSNGAEKSYYKLENIPFQPNATININQPISLSNQGCLINQNNGQVFQTAVINNQCAPTNYVTLNTGNWNGMQQVQNEEQMIYQIMYPIMDGSAMDGPHLTKQTTVDANVLTSGTCTVLSQPAKAISGPSKKHQYELVDKQNQYTNTEIVTVDVVKGEGPYMIAEYEDDKKKKGKKKREEHSESVIYACSGCGESFKSKGQLRFHMTIHNPRSRNKYQCIGCSEGFEKEKMKQEHELQCSKNFKMTQFECCFCDHPFTMPKSLRKHENRHRPKRTTKRYRHTCVCIECNKAFDAIYSLKVHISKYHKKNYVKPFDDKPFSCSECGQGFKYERSKLKHEFKAHMKQEAATL